MTKKSLLWLVPFISFVVGYMIASIFFSAASVTVPTVVGLPLAQGIKALSDQQLSVRIVAEKEDSTVRPETIISQQPSGGLKIKPYHAIFVVIAKAPANKKAPTLVGKTLEQADQELTQLGISSAHSCLPSTAPSDTVIAQHPAPGSELNDRMHLYTAANTNQLCLMPTVVNRQLASVIAFFKQHNIPTNVEYPDGGIKTAAGYVVNEQRPLPGSLINVQNPPTVQLLVQEDRAWHPDILPHTSSETAPIEDQGTQSIDG